MFLSSAPILSLTNFLSKLCLGRHHRPHVRRGGLLPVRHRGPEHPARLRGGDAGLGARVHLGAVDHSQRGNNQSSEFGGKNGEEPYRENMATLLFKLNDHPQSIRG